MTARDLDAEPAAELLERRWFAASGAINNLKSECDALLAGLERAEHAWRQACARLAQLEALRDALGDQLAFMDDPPAGRPVAAIPHEIMSAA
jgi:hypothetical protein